MRKIFVPLELGKDLLDITPKAQFIKYKIDKLNLIKINNFCYSKDIVKRIKRQVPKWEKIFANCISGRTVMSRIHTELSKLNNKKITNKKNGLKI